MNNKPLIAGIGELLWDVLPSGKQLGGAPCNFAFHCIQAGCEGFVVSAIGKDKPGEELKQRLMELGLNTTFIQENEYPTSTVSVELHEQGHPFYTIHENVAWDHIQWDNDLAGLALKLDAVCWGSLAQRNPESRHVIHSFVSALKPGCFKVFDINLRQAYFTKEIIFNSITLADVLKLNEDELPILADFLGFKGKPEKQLDRVFDYFNLKYIVYTMGTRGSIIKSAEAYSFNEAPKIQVVDTIGAGDSFTAFFISGILRGNPLREIHKKASEIASFICTQKGATPQLNNFH